MKETFETKSITLEDKLQEDSKEILEEIEGPCGEPCNCIGD